MKRLSLDASFRRTSAIPWVWPVIYSIPIDLGQRYQVQAAVYHWRGLGKMMYLRWGQGEPEWLHLN